MDVLDGEDGVLFVHQADGRATGDAFVLFSSEDGQRPLEAPASSTSRPLAPRYIELSLRATTAEVQQVRS